MKYKVKVTAKPNVRLRGRGGKFIPTPRMISVDGPATPADAQASALDALGVDAKDVKVEVEVVE